MQPVLVAAHSLETQGLPADRTAEIVGVGLVESALHIGAVLSKRPPAVLLIGSCGAYPSAGLAIGDVVLGRAFVLASSSGELGPVPNAARPPPLSWPPLEREVIVASTLSITTDDDAARALQASSGAHVENLEAFAVARACELARVPFAALLGVTNLVGGRGRAEWRANAARVAASVIARL